MGVTSEKSFGRDLLTDDVLREWQRLMDLGAELLGVRAGLITRLDQSFIEILVSSATPGNPYAAGYSDPFPDSGWFCERTLKQRDRLVIPDASASPEWKDNAAVVNLKMVSYLGVPVEQPDGRLFGTVCFIDDKASAHNATQLKLVDQVRRLVELNLRVVHTSRELAARDRLLDDLSRIYPICSYCKKVRTAEAAEWLPVEEYVRRVTGNRASHGICPGCFERAMAEVDAL
jgi:transcriptional regulator with GAF, ATPase, and Fis domain